MISAYATLQTLSGNTVTYTVTVEGTLSDSSGITIPAGLEINITDTNDGTATATTQLGGSFSITYNGSGTNQGSTVTVNISFGGNNIFASSQYSTTFVVPVAEKIVLKLNPASGAEAVQTNVTFSVSGGIPQNPAIIYSSASPSVSSAIALDSTTFDINGDIEVSIALTPGGGYYAVVDSLTGVVSNWVQFLVASYTISLSASPTILSDNGGNVTLTVTTTVPDGSSIDIYSDTASIATITANSGTAIYVIMLSSNLNAGYATYSIYAYSNLAGF